jgi:hypothetical protein
MPNFAVIKNEVVENVIVAEALIIAQSLLPDYLVVEIEPNNLVAGVGSRYADGKFIPPQPFLSWTLNASTNQWEPPVERPEIEENQMALWNEDSLSWEISNYSLES